MNCREIEELQGMMEESIKIYVNEEMHAQLISDAERFKVVKKDGKVNMNLFLNDLIINYLDDYSREIDQAAALILKSMNPHIFSAKQKEFERIAKKTAFDLIAGTGSYAGNLKKRFSITIRRSSADQICEAIYRSTGTSDVSAYLRGLFAGYLKLPIYRRELVIFRSTVEKINRIIEEGNQLVYTYRTNNRSRVFNPYVITHSKDEIHNYLVGQQENSRHFNTVIRLNNIAHIQDTGESSSFTENFKECYDAMVRNGIQFGNIDSIEMKRIRLTAEGARRFGYRYMERPVPTEIEELEDGSAVYSFDCSMQQLESYFFPFMQEEEPQAALIV